MVPLSRVTASGQLEYTTLQPGDVIHITRECGTIKIKIKRGDVLLFIGKEHFACLMASSNPELTATHAWEIIYLLLKASWILTTILEFSDDMVCAEVRRIATCREEADPNLPSCDAGGDGFGRD